VLLLLLLLLLLLPPQSLVACFPGKLPSGCFPSLPCTWTPLLAGSCQPPVTMEGRNTEIDITSCVQFKEANVLWAKICDGENTPVSTRAKNKNPLLVDITGLNISNKLYTMVETKNGDSICYFNPLPTVDDRTVNSTSIVLVIKVIMVIVIVIIIVVAIIFVLHKLERLPYCFYNLLNCCNGVIVREHANTENQDVELVNCSVESKDDTKEGKKEKKTDGNNGKG